MDATELVPLSYSFSTSFSLSPASLEAFFFGPTALNCLVNGLGRPHPRYEVIEAAWHTDASED
jgi:hypothetical protein